MIERTQVQLPSGYSYQLEGIAPIDGNNYYISTEQSFSGSSGLFRFNLETLSVNEPSNDLAYSVYPNPVSNYLNVDCGPSVQIELVDYLFGKEEVSEIWITFPDPQIKYKRTKHRMTNTAFLERYKQILKPEGVVNLKTDSEFMHGYTLGLLHGAGHEVLYANHNVYKQEGSPEEVTSIQTFYESQYLEQNKPITYIRFKIK